MEHFNGLTPGQLERLAILSEELGETQQAIGKILRHGYDSYDPTADVTPNNRGYLELELGDIMWALAILTKAGDLSKQNVFDNAEIKANRRQKYLHHQNDDENEDEVVIPKCQPTS